MSQDEFNENKNDTYLKLILKIKETSYRARTSFLTNKELDIPKPNLTYKVNIDSSLNKLYLNIKTNYFAKGARKLRLSSKLNFSEKFFDLDANQEKIVSLDLLPMKI